MATINNQLKASTSNERKLRLTAGMRECDIFELAAILRDLGYKMDPEASFDYLNTGNTITYKARSCSIVEADTGLSFANEHARRDKNFEQLQDFRFNSFGWSRGRIYEL